MKLVLGCGLTQGKRIPVAVAGALVVGVVVIARLLRRQGQTDTRGPSLE